MGAKPTKSTQISKDLLEKGSSSKNSKQLLTEYPQISIDAGALKKRKSDIYKPHT